MSLGQNPYVSGTALPGNSPVFYGRESILHEILSTLKNSDNPGNVSLVGERRFGKTSLLNQVYCALEKEPDLITLFGNSQSWHEMKSEDFFRSLSQALVQAVPTEVQGEAYDFPSLRQQIQLLAKKQFRFVLILDEFEFLGENPNLDHRFFAHLRALGDEPQYRFAYLLASRRTLKENCEKHDKIFSSSFWNIFELPYFLKLLEKNEAEGLIREPFQGSLGDGEKSPNPEKVQHWTGAHPALLQLMLKPLWESFQQNRGIDPQRLLSGLGAYYEDLWFRCNREERKILLLSPGKNRLTRIMPLPLYKTEGWQLRKKSCFLPFLPPC